MPDNPFAPPRIDFSGNINDLIQQRQRALLFQEQQQEYQKKLQLQAQRRTALQGLMSGDVAADPTKAIMGYIRQTGDVEGGQGLAEVIKTMRGPQLTPDALLAHADRQASLAASIAARAESAKPQSVREYEAQYGPMAAPGAAAPQAAAATPSGSDWKPTYEQYNLIKSGKMLTKPDATKQLKLVQDQLGRFKQSADDLLKNPNLKYAVGSSVGEILPEWALRTAYPDVQDTRNQIDSLLSQARSNILNMLKETSGRAGTTGLGRVLLQEWMNFGNVITPLQTSSSFPQYKQSLQKVIDYVDASSKRIQDAYDETYGGGGGGGGAPPSPTPVTVAPGEQTISTPPPAGVLSSANAAMPSDPRKMNDQQTINLARQLRQRGMSKEQIIDWFKARGVTIEP